MVKALKIEDEIIRGFVVGENNYHHIEMEDNHGLWIGPEGARKYQEYKDTSYGYGYGGYHGYRHWGKWNDEKKDDKKFEQTIIEYEDDDENFMIIFCPHCGEEIMVEYNADNWCDYCGAYLGHHYSKNLLTM